jgi:hypothetical protein
LTASLAEPLPRPATPGNLTALPFLHPMQNWTDSNALGNNSAKSFSLMSKTILSISRDFTIFETVAGSRCCSFAIRRKLFQAGNSPASQLVVRAERKSGPSKRPTSTDFD